MTPDTITSPAPATGAPFGPDDPRALFARAVALGGDVIAGVRADQLAHPTPCPDFDVRALLGHLVAVLDRVAALGRGDDPFAGPGVAVDVADDGWLEAWFDAAHGVRAAWRDDAVLSRVIHLPWSQLPGGPTLLSYLSEVTVHTWDLAAATGQRPAWDPEVVAASLEAMRRALPARGRAAKLEAVMATMPEEYRGGPPPFADAVGVPDDAPLIDRLVAWNGRRPAAA
jgi:uncharacterized protein (TIGR03086 family)